MIHLIRRFLNTGNTPLNTLISSVQNTVNTINTKFTDARATAIDTINTNVANLNSRLTATRAGYLDYLANSTYGLSALKALIDKYRPWYASTGTTVTLFSVTNAIKANNVAWSGTFTCPQDGLYRVDASLNVGLNNTADTGNYGYDGYIYLKRVDGDFVYYIGSPGEILFFKQIIDTGISGTNVASGSGNVSVYLKKGARYQVGVGYNVSASSSWYNKFYAQMNSCSVKYVKTGITY